MLRSFENSLFEESLERIEPHTRFPLDGLQNYEVTAFQASAEQDCGDIEGDEENPEHNHGRPP